MSVYQAPYLLPPGQPPIPEGEFLLPVCTTKERLLELLTALNADRNLSGNKGENYDFVVDIWRALAFVDDPCKADCVGCGEDKCYEYLPYATSILWEPSDPYRNPTDIPPAYILPPWYVVTSPNAVGGAIGDVLTDLARIPVLPVLPPYDRFPRFRWTVNGAVRVQIYFVAVLAGSMAQIQVDGELLTLQYLDLNRDVISSPPETTEQIVWEHTFATPGEHFIDATIIPVIDDSALPIRFGGGVRKFVVCGAQSLDYCPDCPPCDDCPDCEECEDCEDVIEDEIGLELEEVEVILDCYKHSVGDIKMSAVAQVDLSWLPCDGSTYSKSAYPELAGALVGLTWADETMFATPDLTLKSPMGVGASEDLTLAPLGEDGALFHTLTEGELPPHSHSFGSHTHEVGAHNHPGGNHAHGLVPHNHTTNAHRHTTPDITILTREGSAGGSNSRLMNAGAAGTNANVVIAGGLTDLDTVVVNSTPEGQVTGQPTASYNTGDSTAFNTGAASGTSGSVGAGEGHSSLHPVVGVLFYIFAGCAALEGEC